MEVAKQADVTVHTPTKIRFQEDVEPTTNDVTCVFSDSHNCEVDLGLLSERHHYEVRFFMAHTLGNEVVIPSNESPGPVVVTDVRKYEGRKGHKITMVIKCGNPGQTEQEMTFENSAGEKLTLKVIAKIMANRLGTPALKSGVKILQRCDDDLTDHANENT